MTRRVRIFDDTPPFGMKGKINVTQVGDTIDGRFELDAELGRGGMGEVWRARQMPLGRSVALKLLREEYSMLGHLRRRFAREARAAARLNHENIAAIFDFGQDAQGSMFIAMEFIEGPHLGLAGKHGMSVRQIVEVAFRLLDALAHAHARGVVHRDLKPENILLEGASLPQRLGSPKIVDFGIATLRDERHDSRDTNHDQVVGTPLYMSPEQASGDRMLSPRTDLYSLGMILYELLAGAHPFEHNDSLKVMADQVNTPTPKLIPRPGLVLPEGLEFVVMKALAKSSSERWDSAAFMRAAIEPIRLRTMQDDQWNALPTHFGEEHETFYPPTEVVHAVPSLRDAKHTVVERPSARQATIAEDASSAISPADERSMEQDVRKVVSARHIPFVGRRQECEQLIAMSQNVQVLRQGQIVLIDGEAGVGKTRHAMWLKETLEERGDYRGHIGVFTRGNGNALIGLQEVFESLLRTRGLARAAVEDRLRARIIQWGAAPVDEDITALTDFLRPRVPQAPNARTSRSIASGEPTAQLYALMVRVLESASLAQPRLIILDDVHWAGEEVVDFIDFLVVEMRIRPMPIFVVATARSEDLASVPELARRLRHLNRYTDGPFMHMPLDRMNEVDARELLASLLPLDDELAGILWKRGAGNPLHMILLTRYMVQQEALVPGADQRWHARNLRAVKDAVPPGLADLFKMRLEQLEIRVNSGDRMKRLLIRGAVLGRRFSYDALYEMCLIEKNEELLQTLDEDFDRLLSENFITEVVGRGEEWYTFGHGLMRDVLLEDELGPAQRRTLHRIAAEALISLFGAEATSIAAQIAEHWHAARKLSEAIEWRWRAAQAARRAFRQRDALAGYTVCARWMEQRLGHKSGDADTQLIFDEARFEVTRVSRSRYLRSLVYAGDLHEGLGAFEESEAIYRRVVKMCGKPTVEMPIEILVPLCQAWLGLGHIAWQRGDFTAAHWAFTRVYEVLSEGDVALDIANAALRGLARVAWHRGEYDVATDLARKAHKLALDHSDEEGRAESLWVLGEVARMVALQSRAQEYFEESYEIYRMLQFPTGLAKNLLSQAQLARYHKDFTRAESLYQKSLEQYTSVGDRRGQGMCWNGLGESARFEGNYELSLERYQRALKLFEGIGAQYDVAITCTNLGLLELRRRELEAAEHYLHTALGLVVENDYPYLMAGIGYNLALVKTMRGREEEAAEILKPVWAMNDRVPMSDLDFAEPLEQLGMLRAREGSQKEAEVLWRRARMIYEELDLQQDLSRLDAMIEALKT